MPVGVGVCVTVVVGVEVVVAFGVGLGVAVTFGVDLLVGFRVGPSVGVGDSDIAGMLVGEIKIIFIALSSGTGERIFLPDTSTPTITDTRTNTPMISVSAANVLFLSSIHLQYIVSSQRQQGRLLRNSLVLRSNKLTRIARIAI